MKLKMVPDFVATKIIVNRTNLEIQTVKILSYFLWVYQIKLTQWEKKYINLIDLW